MAAMLRSLGIAGAGVFVPSIMALYAKRDTKGLLEYCRKAVKYVGVFMALPVGLVCGFTKPLLKVWLRDDFEILWLLLVATTLHLGVNVACLLMHNLSTATNWVRTPGIFQIVAGAFNICLGVSLAVLLDWRMYGIAIAGESGI